jgi:hypothetical protein
MVAFPEPTILGFPKYIVCGTTIHKTHFFFHWIDFKDLCEINIILVSYSYTYIHTYCIIIDTILQYRLQPLKLSKICIITWTIDINLSMEINEPS